MDQTQYVDNKTNTGNEDTSADEHGDTTNSDSGKDITSNENKWN